NPISGRRIRRRFQHGHRGFALVVSLSLMVLLTVLAVGLLTLSGISLRSTSRGEAQAAAQANARMALMIALGELQKHAGPDTRITAPANLRDETQPAGLTGVWRSWKPYMTSVSASNYTTQKPDDNFFGHLGPNPDPTATPDTGTPPTKVQQHAVAGEGSLQDNHKHR